MPPPKNREPTPSDRLAPKEEVYRDSSVSNVRYSLQEKLQLVTSLAPVLSGDQFKVAHVLILHFHNTLTGQCFPSYLQLAAKAGRSKWCAMRATHRLRDLGVIAFAESNGGRNRRNTYRLLKCSASAPFNSEKGLHQRTPTVAPAHQCGSTSAPAYIHKNISEKEKERGFQEESKSSAPPNPQRLRAESDKEVNKKFWAKRVEIYQAELDRCTDPDLRAELQKKIDRAVSKAGR